MVLNSIRSPLSFSMNYSETVGWLIWMHHTAPRKGDYGLLKQPNSLVPQNRFLGRFHQSETRTGMIKTQQYCQKGGSTGKELWTKAVSFHSVRLLPSVVPNNCKTFLLLAFLVKTARKGGEFSQITELRGHFPKIKCGPRAQLGNKTQN